MLLKYIYVFSNLILGGGRSYVAVATPFLFRQVGGEKNCAEYANY